MEKSNKEQKELRPMGVSVEKKYRPSEKPLLVKSYKGNGLASES
jgi:hypothetical protein